MYRSRLVEMYAGVVIHYTFIIYDKKFATVSVAFAHATGKPAEVCGY